MTFSYFWFVFLLTYYNCQKCTSYLCFNTLWKRCACGDAHACYQMILLKYLQHRKFTLLSDPRWRLVEVVGWGSCSESTAAPPPSTSRASLTRASSTCSTSSTRRGLTSAAQHPYASGSCCVLQTRHRVHRFPLLPHLVPQVETTEGQERRTELRGWGRKVEGRSRHWAPRLCSGNFAARAEGSWTEEKERLMTVQQMAPTNSGCAQRALSTLTPRASCLTSTKRRLNGAMPPRGGTLPLGHLLPQCPCPSPGPLLLVWTSQFTPALKTWLWTSNLPPHPPWAWTLWMAHLEPTAPANCSSAAHTSSMRSGATGSATSASSARQQSEEQMEEERGEEGGWGGVMPVSQCWRCLLNSRLQDWTDWNCTA